MCERSCSEGGDSAAVGASVRESAAAAAAWARVAMGNPGSTPRSCGRTRAAASPPPTESAKEPTLRCAAAALSAAAEGARLRAAAERAVSERAAASSSAAGAKCGPAVAAARTTCMRTLTRAASCATTLMLAACSDRGAPLATVQSHTAPSTHRGPRRRTWSVAAGAGAAMTARSTASLALGDTSRHGSANTSSSSTNRSPGSASSASTTLDLSSSAAR